MSCDRVDFLNRASLVSIPNHIGDEIGNVAPGKRDMFDTAVDDEPIHNRDYMSHSVSWVEDSPSVADITCHSWWGNQSKNCLHSDVKSLDVEGLEHDLSHVLPILGWIEGRFGQDEDVFLGVATEIVEHTPVPELLHEVPIADDTSFNGVDYFMCTI